VLERLEPTAKELASDWLITVSCDQEEQAVLERLEATAKDMDSSGEGELTEEELCTAVNQQDQLKVSKEEVSKKRGLSDQGRDLLRVSLVFNF